MTRRELIAELGSESAVSMFLSGQRNLIVEQVRKLNAGFNVSSDVFLAHMAV
jgi:antitoxin component HigA of HigAB toxin-antitoxin module